MLQSVSSLKSTDYYLLAHSRLLTAPSLGPRVVELMTVGVLGHSPASGDLGPASLLGGQKDTPEFSYKMSSVTRQGRLYGGGETKPHAAKGIQVEAACVRTWQFREVSLENGRLSVAT